MNKFGDEMAPCGTPSGILQTDDLLLDLPTLTWKVRPLRKECMIRARKNIITSVNDFMKKHIVPDGIKGFIHI
jgi:hypothetical protein